MNGVTVTTGSILTPEEQEIEYVNTRNARDYLKIVTGDKDSDGKPTDGIMIFEPDTIKLFTVRSFVDEKTAAQRHGIVRPTGAIPPQLHRR